MRPYVEALLIDPHAASDAWLDGLPESDRRILLDPARRESDAVAALEANRQAGAGWIDDDLALLRPWGFGLEEITVPVRLWQGEVDVLVPPAHSRRLAARIPTAELVQVPRAGHWLDAQHPDMLAWLTAR